MFDYSVLAIDLRPILLKKEINLKEAHELLVYFCISTGAKTRKIFPNEIIRQKQMIAALIINALNENKIAYNVHEYKTFYVKTGDGYGYEFGNATVELKDIISWAKSAGIPVAEDFYAELCCLKTKAGKKTSLGNETERKDESLNGKERQELGRLRVEKEKWDESIRIAVKAGILFSAETNSGIKFTRKEFEDVLREDGCKDIEGTVLDRIWKALPACIRSKGGRPKGKKDVH